MNTPPNPPGQDSGKTVSLLFIGAAVGAVLAFLFITVVLVCVLWFGGFFAGRNVASPNPNPTPHPNVAPPRRVETRVRPDPVPGRDFEVTLERPERRNPAPAPAPGDVAPLLHIRSKSLNVLDGKPLVMETASVVQQTGDGYLIVRDSQNLRITGPFTVSAWFQARTLERAMTIGSRALNGPPWTPPFSSWLLRINSPNHLEGSLSDGRGYSPSTWSVSLEPGQWYHAVLTYDGNTKRMFLNGAMQPRLASGTLTNPTGIGNAPGRSILIGADESESPAAEIFDGAIDDVRVFNRGLPEEEVQSLFTEGAKRYGLNP